MQIANVIGQSLGKSQDAESFSHFASHIFVGYRLHDAGCNSSCAAE